MRLLGRRDFGAKLRYFFTKKYCIKTAKCYNKNVVEKTAGNTMLSKQFVRIAFSFFIVKKLPNRKTGQLFMKSN